MFPRYEVPTGDTDTGASSCLLAPIDTCFDWEMHSEFSPLRVESLFASL